MPHNDTDYWVRVAIVAIAVLIGAFDLLLLWRYGRDKTISAVVTQWGHEFPFLPYLIAFGMGAFMYHLAFGSPS